MKYKDFSFQLVLRTLILLLSVMLVGAGFFIIKDKHLIFIPLTIVIFIAFQVAGIIKLVKRANMEITEVFDRIKKGNYFPSLPAGKYTDSFSDLYATINDIFSVIRDTETNREAHNIFTEMLVSRIPVGVILLRSDGSIKLINDFARDLLRIPHFTRWAEIKKYLPAFASDIENIGDKGTGCFRFESNGQLYQISMNISSIFLFGELNRVITFHDIRSSIEKAEIEAWSKLFRVIRHEILNSVTPISSLAETMQLILKTSSTEGDNGGGLHPADARDINECVNAIKQRSDGLYNFVNLYRDISRIPVPVKEKISVHELANSVLTLLKPRLEEKRVKMDIDLPHGELYIHADYGLMQQVLINLANNSLNALESSENPVIKISGKLSADKLMLTVQDNGPGIPGDLLEDIFVPFFTTRRNGSGLGLSIVKQIIVSHGGNISVDSLPGDYTRFIIEMQIDDHQPPHDLP